MKNLKFMLLLVICFMLSPAVFALNDETKELKIEVVDFEKQASQDATFENFADFNFDVKILESFGLDQLHPTQKTQLIKFEINSENEILLNKRLNNSKKILYIKNLQAINSKLYLIHINPGLRK
jgi:hypothetical protein